MTAVQLHGPRDMQVESCPAPDQPGGGEVCVHVDATGICGSDLHWYLDGRIGATAAESPVILGHEFAGTVVSGGGVAADGAPLYAGERVAVDPNIPCTRCTQCRAGAPNLCEAVRFLGQWPEGGSLRERLNVPAQVCHRLSPALSPVEGALLEPLGVALFALDLAHIRTGEPLAILGAGPIGLLTLQAARAAGADPVYVSDRLPWRLELARQLGATLTVDITKEDPVDLIRSASGRVGVPRVVEAAWGAEAVSQAIELAAPGGRVVLVGISSDDRLVVPATTLRRKGLTLAACRRMRHVYPRAMRLVTSGAVDLGVLVTHRFSLGQTPQAFALTADYAEGVVKCVIVHDGHQG